MELVYFFAFLKIFALLVCLFGLVMIFFVYPTNILYKNEKLKPSGDTNRSLLLGFSLLCFMDILLYFYYHLNSGYLCGVSKYYTCLSLTANIAVYVLLFIHLSIILVFNGLFINKLLEVIKTKKLDIWLFSFATVSIVLTMINYKIYDSIYSDISLVHLGVVFLVILVNFAPIYSFLLLNFLLKPREKKIIKKKTKPVAKKDTAIESSNIINAK